MENETTLKDVLSVFTYYGFKKASMDDLARAAGVSRQTLYSRFKTKEGVLDWAVGAALGHARDAAATALEKKASVEACLSDAFARWCGDNVPFLRAPHGSEALDLGSAALQRLGFDPQEGFEAALIKFLQARGICESAEAARDKAYLLLMASKGLLVKSETSESFSEGMRRIIRAAI